MVFQKSFFDGNVGSNTNMQTGKKEMTSEEIAAKKKSVGLFPELNYAKTGMDYQLLGIEDQNGTKMYVLRTFDGKNESYDYFDTKTYLKIKSLSIMKEGDETVELTSTFGEFKEINGILFPHASNLSTGEMAFSGKVTSILVNGKIDLSSFK